jgi:P pilus assembly chaperone PapD
MRTRRTLRLENPRLKARACIAGLALLLVLCPCWVGAGLNVGPLTLEKQAVPGETYRGTIALTNNTDSPQAAVLYQTDYLFFADGSNLYGEPGKNSRSNANWITFSPHQVTVPPHQTTQVSYQVDVPGDSTLRGTYWSMLMVEEIGPPPDTSRTLARNQTSIRQVVRYGVQYITQIDGGQEKLTFTGTKLVLDGDRKQLQVDVENGGDRWIVPSSWIELYDSGGQHVGRFEGEKRRLYPGTSVRFRIDLGATSRGKYKALVVLDGGDQKVFGAKYDLEF